MITISGTPLSVEAGSVFFIGLIVALLLTILAFIFLLPEKRRACLGGFGRAIHDFLNFKYLIIEYLLRFIYVLLTISCIIFGFIVMFAGNHYGMPLERAILSGLAFVILGPIAIRFAYEFLMMSFLLINNVIQINRKIPYNDFKKQKKTPRDEAPAAPFAPKTPAPTVAPEALEVPDVPETPADSDIFCPFCGTKQSAENTVCTNCQNKIR